jgi:hypothetical protein
LTLCGLPSSGKLRRALTAADANIAIDAAMRVNSLDWRGKAKHHALASQVLMNQTDPTAVR